MEQIRHVLANLPDELRLLLVGLPLSGNIHHFIPHNWEFRLFQLVDFWELCHHLICGGLCLGLLHQSRRHSSANGSTSCCHFGRPSSTSSSSPSITSSTPSSPRCPPSSTRNGNTLTITSSKAEKTSPRKRRRRKQNSKRNKRKPGDPGLFSSYSSLRYSWIRSLPSSWNVIISNWPRISFS